MPYNERELLAGLIKYEAGGKGDNGINVVAIIMLNRASVPYGEFSRANQGGSIRNIIEQPGQFTHMITTVGGQYNAQDVYDMDPEEIHYQIADAVMTGNVFAGVGNSLFYFNPCRPTCPDNFPPGGVGIFYSHVYQHHFYAPTERYQFTQMR